MIASFKPIANANEGRINKGGSLIKSFDINNTYHKFYYNKIRQYQTQIIDLCILNGYNNNYESVCLVPPKYLKKLSSQLSFFINNSF